LGGRGYLDYIRAILGTHVILGVDAGVVSDVGPREPLDG